MEKNEKKVKEEKTKKKPAPLAGSIPLAKYRPIPKFNSGCNNC